MSDARYPGIDYILKQLPQKKTWVLGGLFTVRPDALIPAAQQVDTSLFHCSFAESMTRPVDPKVRTRQLDQKVVQLRGWLYTRHPMEEVDRFVKNFIEKHRYKQVDIAEFFRCFRERFDVDLQALLHELYHEREGAQFEVKGYREYALEGQANTYACTFKVWNRGKKEGTLRLSFTEGQGASSIPVHEYLSLPAGEAREYCLVWSGKPGSTIKLGGVRNLPDGLLPENSPRSFFGVPPTSGEKFTTGVWLIDTTEFLPAEGEYIVDNRDVGFRGEEGENGKWAERLREKQQGWEAFYHDAAHGKTMRDFLFHKAGKTGAYAEWRGQLPRAGRYELFVHVPTGILDNIQVSIQEEGRLRIVSGKQLQEYTQNYTLYRDGKEEHFSLDLKQAKEAWISVGKFDFPAGESRLQLHSTLSNPHFYVIADAVKWVKVQE